MASCSRRVWGDFSLHSKMNIHFSRFFCLFVVFEGRRRSSSAEQTAARLILNYEKWAAASWLIFSHVNSFTISSACARYSSGAIHTFHFGWRRKLWNLSQRLLLQSNYEDWNVLLGVNTQQVKSHFSLSFSGNFVWFTFLRLVWCDRDWCSDLPPISLITLC